MKKLFMVLGFLILLLSSLSARYIFDGKIIFSKHATNKDSLAYLIIEKAGGVLDTFAIVDTSGTVTFHYSFKGLNICDGELNTADSVSFVQVVPVLYYGAVYTVHGTAHYSSTDGVDDNIYTHAPSLSLPKSIAAGDVVIDTMTLRLYTQGNEDSVHIFLQKAQDGANTKVDSVWFGGNTTGWAESSNILQNGDITILDNYVYTLWLDCVNNGATDIRAELGVRIVYHLE